MMQLAAERYFIAVFVLQQSVFLLALLQHVRYHMALKALEQQYLQYNFRNRHMLEVLSLLLTRILPREMSMIYKFSSR